MVEIVCASPLHILTAVALKYTYYKEKKVSVILMDYTYNSDMLYERLQKSGVFENVDYIKAKTVWDNYTVKSNKFFKLRFLNSSIGKLNKLKVDWKEIDELLYPYHEPYAILLSKHISKVNDNCKFIYYDDGSASYANMANAIAEKPGRIELFSGVPIRFFIPHKLFLFAPELTNLSDVAKVNKIEFPSEEQYLNKVNDIFGYKEMEFRKYIFFDQCSNNPLDDNEIKKLNHILNILDKNFDRKEIYIKKHPKRTGREYEERGWEIFPEPQYMPFELALLNIQNENETTLISDYSTACMMPKIVLGVEPRIVFLCNILNDNINDGIRNIIKTVKSIYTKNVVFCPTSEKELKDSIN